MSQLPGPTIVPGTPPPGSIRYDLSFQISPIILEGGIVSTVQGGLSAITNFLPTNPDGSPFARFLVVPGGTIMSQAIGMYPFANQQVAANATIQQPLSISLRMIAPVNQPGGYASKLNAFTALQATLNQHNVEGGTYVVVTPAFIYDPCVFLTMTDISEEIEADGNKQAQIEWQLDFIKPLITLAGASTAQNALISKITAGTAFSSQPAWSGLQNASPANQPGVAGLLSAYGVTEAPTGP